MNRKVRAIIVDGTEIMTSLTAVEIADRLRTYDDLKDEVNRKDNIINEIERLKEENRTYQEYPFIIVEKNGVICRKNQEIERLNNIINELEKYIDDNYFYDDVGMKIFDVSLLEDKLKELKENGNNE